LDKVRSAASFSKKFSASTKNLDDRLQILLQDATVDAIHDIRTSIRKMEAAIDLLPKKVRNKEKIRRYFTSSKKLFKSTSRVRDADIIISNLHGFELLPAVSIAISKLESERNRRVFEVLDHAERLDKTKIPKVKKNQVGYTQLKKRKTKICLVLESKIAELLPAILRDFRKIDELHDLRKYCKNLRYVLDILPSEGEKDLRRLMENWQKLLGTVRDIHMIQLFIDENKLPNDLEQLVSDLNLKRDRTLESFIHSFEDHLEASNQTTFTLAKSIAT
jgi:CHAD domain-containing protein